MKSLQYLKEKVESLQTPEELKKGIKYNKEMLEKAIKKKDKEAIARWEGAIKAKEDLLKSKDSKSKDSADKKDEKPSDADEEELDKLRDARDAAWEAGDKKKSNEIDNEIRKKQGRETLPTDKAEYDKNKEDEHGAKVDKMLDDIDAAWEAGDKETANKLHDELRAFQGKGKFDAEEVKAKHGLTKPEEKKPEPPKSPEEKEADSIKPQDPTDDTPDPNKTTHNPENPNQPIPPTNMMSPDDKADAEHDNKENAKAAKKKASKELKDLAAKTANDEIKNAKTSKGKKAAIAAKDASLAVLGALGKGFQINGTSVTDLAKNSRATALVGKGLETMSAKNKKAALDKIKGPFDKKIKELETQIKELKDNITDAEEDDESESEIESIDSEIDDINDKITELKAKKKYGFEDAVQKLGKQKEELSKKKMSLKGGSKDVVEMKKKKAELEARLTQVNDAYKELMDAAKESNESISYLMNSTKGIKVVSEKYNYYTHIDAKDYIKESLR